VVPSTVQIVDGGGVGITLVDPPLGVAGPADPDDPALVPLAFDDTCLVDTDGVGLAKTEPLTTAQVALGALSCAAPQAVDRVLIGRDDDFADALSSGVMQADSPLLLVPGDGPVTDEVLFALAGLGTDEVVILGGVAAVGTAVESQLAAMGLTVERRQGPTRIETAVDVASTDAPAATTAIVARAFGGDIDASQAFADAIAAGAMAADLGYPVLLTDTDELSTGTADYLGDSPITDVLIMGGTTAVSDAVEQQLQAIVPGEVTRVASDSRFGTSVEVAKARGIDSAAEVAQVILVEGQADDAWAGGLTAAFAAARDDSPILLLNGAQVPAETAAFLTGAQAATSTTFAVALGQDVITCAGQAAGCAAARRLLGFDGTTVALDPPSQSTVQPGDLIAVTFGDGAPTDAEVVVGGSCLAVPTTDLADVVIRADAQLPCLVTVTVTFPSGAVQRVTAIYQD
jgi:putative cell wall-binding protein